LLGALFSVLRFPLSIISRGLSLVPRLRSLRPEDVINANFFISENQLLRTVDEHIFTKYTFVVFTSSAALRAGFCLLDFRLSGHRLRFLLIDGHSRFVRLLCFRLRFRTRKESRL
jgi:hypothetical protein